MGEIGLILELTFYLNNKLTNYWTLMIPTLTKKNVKWIYLSFEYDLNMKFMIRYCKKDRNNIRTVMREEKEREEETRENPH